MELGFPEPCQGRAHPPGQTLSQPSLDLSPSPGLRFLGFVSLVSGFVLHEQWFHREYPGGFEWSVFMVCVRACDPGGDPDFWANAIIGVGLPALMVALAVMLFANSWRRWRQAT